MGLSNFRKAPSGIQMWYKDPLICLSLKLSNGNAYLTNGHLNLKWMLLWSICVNLRGQLHYNKLSSVRFERDFKNYARLPPLANEDLWPKDSVPFLLNAGATKHRNLEVFWWDQKCLTDNFLVTASTSLGLLRALARSGVYQMISFTDLTFMWRRQLDRRCVKDLLYSLNLIAFLVAGWMHKPLRR
jgi:hypothetical protein